MEPFCREGDFVLVNPVRNFLPYLSRLLDHLPFVGKQISNGVNRMSYLFSRPRVGQLIVLKDPMHSSLLILKRITAVQDSFLWVEGDNKEKSIDSRHFGWVGKEYIIGNAHIVGKPRTTRPQLRSCWRGCGTALAKHDLARLSYPQDSLA